MCGQRKHTAHAGKHPRCRTCDRRAGVCGCSRADRPANRRRAGFPAVLRESGDEGLLGISPTAMPVLVLSRATTCWRRRTSSVTASTRASLAPAARARLSCCFNCATRIPTCPRKYSRYRSTTQRTLRARHIPSTSRFAPSFRARAVPRSLSPAAASSDASYPELWCRQARTRFRRNDAAGATTLAPSLAVSRSSCLVADRDHGRGAWFGVSPRQGCDGIDTHA